MIRPIPGADPHPRRPKLKVPPGACDCHCHVFGPADRFPYSPERNYTPPDATLEQYLDLLNILGFERSVIVQPSVYGTDNTCTEDGIRRMNGRGRGIAVISPDIADEELARLNDAGFRGARLNLIHPGGSTPLNELERIAERVAAVGWHVQIYTRGPILAENSQRLARLPTDLVIDHLGHMEAGKGLDQQGFRTLLDLVESGRCWVKLCPYRFDTGGAPWSEARPYARKLYQTAPDRMIWGTDWPHPDIPGPSPREPGLMPNDGDLVDALGDWFADEQAIQRILVDNPARLYGFDGQDHP